MVSARLAWRLQVLDHFAIADGLDARSCSAAAYRCQQPADLVDQPGGEHRVDTRVDPRVQSSRGQSSTNTRQASAGGPRRTALQLADRLAGLL